MKIETNLNTIYRIAKVKEDENKQFRLYLKQLDIEKKELDKIVSVLTDEITPQIDCTLCANCCKGLSPIVETEDINRLASHFEMNPNDFIDEFIMIDAEEDYTFKETPCPFLENNLCTVYENRLNTCRNYPHLYRSNFIHRLYGVLQNYQYCPIVFNVFDLLKEKLNFTPPR